MSSFENNLIQKKILFAGRGPSNFEDGAKVLFQVKAELCNENETKLLDDSRKWSKPVELILGKKFKLEVWESCVKTMCVGEVSQFDVDKMLLSCYPSVSKALRDFEAKQKGEKVVEKSHHCCGMGLKEGLGYEDLDCLIVEPKNLRFTIELLKIHNTGSYEKEFWSMNETEQLKSANDLREKGNQLYKQKDTKNAASKYSEAIARLEHLMLREKPNDVEWNVINQDKLILLLNLAQCELVNENFYSAIQHCSEVIKFDADNVKALFRRAKANVSLCASSEAKNDIYRIRELDPSLDKQCKKLLAGLANNEKEKLANDKKAFKGLFS